ncbi:MAG: polysaccharide deacetylase family protein, partial [Nanoarchaeota archaeon]|nr:polysaccharide deacetylase family protein [Nanoarchaeota archaeon]
MKYTDVPILMYHEISNQDNAWCVSPAEFEKQMQFLKDNGYKTITLDELKERVEENKETDERPIVITFNDAREGVYTNAYPILKKHGFTATIYVVPKWIEENTSIPDNEVYSDFLTWNELKELSENGFGVGSHTYSHKNLASLTDTGLFEELDKADNIINEKVSLKVKHFCYPYGKFSNSILNVIKNRYDTAVTTEKGFNKLKGIYSRQWVLKGTSLDFFVKSLSQPKMSLCMIVKNEEKYLEQCLNSVK